MQGKLAHEYLSLLLQLLMWVGHHQHWFAAHVRPRHPRLFARSAGLYLRGWWLVQHWPASNVLRPGP
jgi:hypothetical protein